MSGRRAAITPECVRPKQATTVNSYIHEDGTKSVNNFGTREATLAYVEIESLRRYTAIQCYLSSSDRRSTRVWPLRLHHLRRSRSNG